MKKTITLLAAAMIMMVAEAQASRLFLTTPSGRVTAFVDGQQYYSHNGFFQINQMRPGVNRIRVIRNQRQGRGQHQRDRAQGVVFRGQIMIPRQSDVYARVTPRGGLIIDRVVPRHRANRNNRVQTRQGRGSDYGRGSQNYNRNGNRGGVRAPAGRNSNFAAALRTVRVAGFDSQRRTIAKQYLRNNTVTSRQVLQLMRAFDFESSRLEIAKFAYASTIDPENYFVVNQGFDFASSSAALNRYIR